MDRRWSEWRKASTSIWVFFWVLGVTVLAATNLGRAQQPAGVALTREADMAQRANKARDLTHAYAEKLRVGLVQALKEVGPVGAIGACNTLAPDLNATVSDGSTFEISRTALRVRNPENAPDSWEQAVLDQFQKAAAGGADARVLETFDIVTTAEGQKLFRYMRPIVMREPCMACHGVNVTQDVKAEIAKYYSDDKATGYTLGEIRGAFSLVQQLD